MLGQRGLYTLVVSFLFTLLVAGCVAAVPAANTPTEVSPEESSAVSPEDSSDTARTITHLRGETTIAQEPEQIAVTEYRLADPLLALGIKPIAMGSYMGGLNLDWLEPGTLDGVIDVGQDGNPEAILTANPDFIIAWEPQNPNYEALSKIAPTIVINQTEDWRGDFISFGELMNKKAEAEQWMADYQARAEELKAELAPKLEGGKTAVYMRVLAKEFRMQATDHRLAGILYEDLGIPVPEKIHEIVKREAVSMEALPLYDADYLFIQVGSAVAGGDKEAEQRLAELQESSIWNNLTAVKNNHVFVVPFYVDVDFPLANAKAMELVAELILDAP